MIANVNRYAYLLGACNSVLYAVVYFSLTLYSSAAYSLLVSSPMTFMTFLNWNKKKQGGSTQLKRLTNMQRVFVAIACIIGWGLLYVVFNPQGSQYILLDNAVSVLGITTSVLAMLRYREYGVLSIMNYCAGVILYICMLPDNPGQITYLIYSLYTVCCAITTTINLRKM